MFLVMEITGKVGGATAQHLLAQGKEVRALVRNRAKATSWANQGVELVDGDWNDSAAIQRALKGVEGAFVMLPTVWAPSPDYKEAKGVIANYVEALTKAAPPRVVALTSMGADRGRSPAWGDHGLVASGARVSRPEYANRICARRWDSSKTSSTACRSPRAERYRSTTIRQTGNRPWSRRTTSARRSATPLTGPAWSGQRIVELGSMVTADEVAEQLGEVLELDVKAFAIPRAGWAQAFEQFGVPKGHTGPAEEMSEAVNAGWMDLEVKGTEHVAGTTSARDVFAAAQKAMTA